MDAAAAVSEWRVSSSVTVLGLVADGRASAAIWHRPLWMDVLRDVRALSAGSVFRYRAALDRRSPEQAIGAVLDPLGGAAALPALARDLRQLLALMAAIDGLAPRGLRLEAIDDDGCRRFHADRVAVRLLCTYVGAGTELLPEDAVDRGAMGQGDNGHVLDVRRIAAVPTGAVLLMRGDLSPHGPGVLHRSPPNPLGSPRVLVAIDA
ncbi:MAG: hypothetical protein KatS3mg127_2009 [Silanimonas sp.]|nr:MAG: hypothetical protein KatS3mg127_2009 [Silanimonas sp.]